MSEWRGSLARGNFDGKRIAFLILFRPGNPWNGAGAGSVCHSPSIAASFLVVLARLHTQNCLRVAAYRYRQSTEDGTDGKRA